MNLLNKLIEWCLKNGFLVSLFGIAIVGAGYYAMINTPVDAIPDIGEKQVIVFADWPGRSPQDIDNQVTYPLSISLSGTPGVKTIRSMSGLGFSMLFVIFKDEVDYYWARSRVLERLNVAQQRLPVGVIPVLGPDATALGQVYWYTVEAEGFDLAELRSVQDWFIRYQLNSVEGVSEVATVGGFVKQYQINVNPDKLRAYKVSHIDLYESVMRSNLDVSAKVIEKAGMEYFIRGVGFIKSIEDIENIVVKEEEGTPVFVRNVATVTIGPDFRRGSLDKGGVEAVGGIVLMRYGANPQEVVDEVKKRINLISVSLPKKTLANGKVSQVKIVPFYDRTIIVKETLDTLKDALLEESILCSIVILVFLMHVRSTISVLVTFPLAFSLCFILMYFFKIDSNIMSLAGLAIAIGDVGDMGIIMTENIYRHIANGDNQKSHFQKVYEGTTEVAGAIITAVSNTIFSFIPVFFLTDQEGKLFRPLAFTKTFAISASVILAITVVPTICLHLFKPSKFSKEISRLIAAGIGFLSIFISKFALLQLDIGKYSGWPIAITIGCIIGLLVSRMLQEKFLPMEENGVAKFIGKYYSISLRWVLGHKIVFMILPILILVTGISIWSKTGNEFMPPLDEGSILYMPTLLPQAGLSEAVSINSKQDLAIGAVPEVHSVVGKIGRSGSALDPAPISMVETIINLKPESEWRKIPVQRWFSGLPKFLKAPLVFLFPEERQITKNEVLKDIQERSSIPGVIPTFLQPIQARIVMLQTGFRAMMGVKIYGKDLKEIEKIGLQMEDILKSVPGTVDVIADRIVGKPYLEFNIDRVKIARYGINIKDVQDAIEIAIGGMNVTETVEERERYPVQIRYLREFRNDIPELEKIFVPTINKSTQIPLSQLVTIKSVLGPQEIKGEKGLLTGYVTLNTRDRDEIGVVEDAEKALQGALRAGHLIIPAGYYWEWSGQFENQRRATARMKIVIPVCLFLMFLMLYMGFERKWIAFIIYFGVLVSASGGFIMLSLWHVNLSVAVWVGFLVLFGVVDDDGVVISTYLESIFKNAKFNNIDEIREAVLQGGLKRIRPCLMTAATTIFGLAPIFWSNGRGSDIMQPMAIPSVGGMLISIVTLFIVPCLFCAVEEWKWKRSGVTN